MRPARWRTVFSISQPLSSKDQRDFHLKCVVKVTTPARDSACKHETQTTEKPKIYSEIGSKDNFHFKALGISLDLVRDRG